MKRDLILWASIFAGPLIWFLHEEANFALAPWACTLQWKPALIVITVISLALCAGSAFVAWREWHEVGREWPGEAGGSVARSRAMATGGLLLSAMFFLVIFAQGIAEVILGACE